jgi:two-component system LytT family response regulator
MRSANAITCVIVDDEFPAVKLLADYVQKSAGLALMLQTTSALEGLNYVTENKPDLVFLDVQMPELNGMEIINLIKNTGSKVILTTAYTNYAIDGYEHDIVDYLLKPITLQRFMLSINKVKARISNEKAALNSDFVALSTYIFVKTEYRSQKVDLAAIRYIEGLGDYVTVHTDTGKILSLDRMKNMEQLLPADRFIRIHKSFIVNINHINFIEKGRIIINKEYLPVGEAYKEKVKERLGL